jgi:hypothetical protein
MKSLFFALLLSVLTESTAATPTKNIQTCELEDGSDVTLQAQQDPAGDGDRFYLSMDAKSETAFTDIPEADYVGKVVLSKCLNHVLIYVISYGAPYLKGVVIRRTADNRTTHRIDFSEKALPELLYLNRRETKLAVPNAGYEVSSKYLVYRYQLGKGQDEEAAASDVLPAETGFEVIRIQR